MSESESDVSENRVCGAAPRPHSRRRFKFSPRLYQAGPRLTEESELKTSLAGTQPTVRYRVHRGRRTL